MMTTFTALGRGQVSCRAEGEGCNAMRKVAAVLPSKTAAYVPPKIKLK